MPLQAPFLLNIQFTLISKIKRHEYIFEELIREEREGTLFEKEKGDDEKSVFIPESFKDYKPVSFLNLKNCYE